MRRIQSLRTLTISTPPNVARAIEAAKPVCRAACWSRQVHRPTAVTANLGYLSGGTSMNLVPAEARAGLDIRLPIGVSVTDIVDSGLMSPPASIEMKVLVWRGPTTDGELFKLLIRNGAEIMHQAPVVNMRVGGSDTRLFRSRGIASAVYRLHTHNMGGPDEFVTIDDLRKVFYVHTLTAFDSSAISLARITSARNNIRNVATNSKLHRSSGRVVWLNGVSSRMAAGQSPSLRTGDLSSISRV